MGLETFSEYMSREVLLVVFHHKSQFHLITGEDMWWLCRSANAESDSVLIWF